MTSETKLRTHIRGLLHDYVLTHLTRVDYGEFTQQLVYELLSDRLTPVTITDHAQSLTLPVDPLDHYLQRYCTQEDKIQCERITLSKEEHRFLSRISDVLFRDDGLPPSESWLQRGSPLDRELAYFDPPSFQLSARAIQETPKIGFCAKPGLIPKSQEDVVRSNKMAVFTGIEEPEMPQTDEEHILRTKLTMDRSLRPKIQALYRVNPYLTSEEGDSGPSGSEKFLLCPRSPPPRIHTFFEEPPLFPISQARGFDTSMGVKGHHMVDMTSMSDLLSTAAMVKVDNDEDDLEDQHTVVINGWQAIEIPSSPRTPSLADVSSEVDELLLESPEPKHVPINKLVQLKLSEVVMPRSTSIGGIREKPPYLGEGSTLFDFVSPLIKRFDEPRIITSPKSQLSSPQTALLSLLGEPPTVVDGPEARRSTSPDSDEDPLRDLRLLHGIATIDPLHVIAHEQLIDDDDDNIGLMEVAKLSEPTEHGPNPFMPNTMSDLIAPQVAPKRASAAQNQVFNFMKKVKGAKDLTLQLSWRPFKFDDKVPTDVELAQVISLAELNVVDENFAHLQELLIGDESDHDIDLEEQWMLRYMTRSPHVVPQNLTQNLLDSLCDTRTILTRDDRRRLAKLRGDELSEPELSEANASIDEPQGAQSDDEASEIEDRDNKRMKLGDVQFHGYDPNAECSTAVSVSHESGLCLAPMLPVDPVDADDFDDAEMLPIAWVPSGVPATAIVDEERLAMRSPGDPWSLEDYFDDNAPVDPFVPLSLDSQISYPAVSQIARSKHSTPGRDHLHDTMSTLPDSSVANYTDVSLSVPPPSPKVQKREPGRCKDSDLLGRYLALRSEKPWTCSPELSPIILSVEDLPVEMPQEASEGPYCISEELIDCNTLTLPDTDSRPLTIHTYLASVEMIQKRSLIRHLSSRGCSVRLVERETLGGADLILDSDTALVYFSLFSLPSQSRELQSRLEVLSWRFRHICVIFGAYPASQDLSANSTDGLAPCAFSPPTIRAVKKFKRDLGIAEAFHSKCAESTIYFAFALSVEEAARYARLFGDKAERVSRLQVWDDRQWLGEEDLEDEYYLASAKGMNAFTAAAILHHVSLDDFLALTPDQRLEFGCLVGEQRIAILNDVISKRSEVIHDASSQLPE